ncbi:hypothetical protein ACFCYF_15815 [Streptomyces chartreusis]|uniref:hypothetical protein n=1 Tax=Streptomyces chartreusis TaxID=1969 RepID=UPI0035DD0490
MNPTEESARGLNQLQGHLLWAAEIDDARRQASRFVENLPWLTTSQREDVERVYTSDRITASRASLERICRRAAELRTEYECRYRKLRARCIATTIVILTAGACTAGAALLLRQ